MRYSRQLFRRDRLIAGGFVLALLLLTATARAQTPSYYVLNSGNCNVIPFSPSTSTTFQKWQGFFAPNMFPGAYAGNISKIYFKYCNTNSGTTYSNFQVSLAQTTATSISTGQWFSPMTQCLSSSSYYIASGSSGNWFSITLTTPFYYNPNQELIVQVCSSGHSGSGFGVDHGYNTSFPTAPYVGRIYGGGNGCATTNPSGSTTGYLPSFGFDLNPALPDDAGISELISPVAFCAGSHDIQVKLYNYGTNTLNNVTINWSLNGVPQTPINWTTPLASLATATVTLATQYSFSAGTPYNLVVWTSNPNNTQDSFPGNDSLTATMQSSLSGTFTIGGTSPDYATFADAVDDLNNYGVCGPVVFNVRPGTYNERVVFSSIAGASAINTVTFQSETGNLADVTLTYTSSGTGNNGVLVFGGAEFVTFKDMTIRTGSTGTYSMVVDLGSSTDCTVEGCELIGASVNTTSNYAAVVYSYTSNNDRTTIRNCGIRDGSYGLYMRGASNTSTQDDCVIEGNEITGAYYTAYYSYYQGFEQFHDNVINLGPGYTYDYLSFFYYGHDASIERNRWFGTGRNYCYGVYYYYQNYYVSGQSRFVNNMITLRGHTYPYRAMYKYRSYNTLFAFNTFWMDGNYTSSYLIYDYYPSGCEYYNNIFYQAGTGYAWYLYSGTTVTASDYNLFYTGGNNFIYWDGTRNDLAALQNASGMDQHSLVKTVYFKDVTTGDLHLTSPSEDDTDLFGILLSSVTQDIDHELRVNPYMGADEACYIMPGSVNYDFVDAQGLPAAYAEAPGTIGIHYSVAFPDFDATIEMTVSFYDVRTNVLAYQTVLTAQKQYGVTLDGVQYITLPASIPAGAYKVEVNFWTKNSCGTYRDYMPYPSALLVVPEGRVPCVVWPGDVNNDAIVNYTDRRELNRYIYDANLRTSWLNGPARYQADQEQNPFTYLEWKPQASAPWYTQEGCYMDTDGNGVINNLDYIAMKLNWSKYTPLYTGAPKSAYPVSAASFSMDQNYPNPFNPVTMIRYNAPETSHVLLTVTDALGRRVAELKNGTAEKGVHEVQFDGSNLSSGSYIATITMTGEESGLTFTKTIKMVLNK